MCSDSDPVDYRCGSDQEEREMNAWIYDGFKDQYFYVWEGFTGYVRENPDHTWSACVWLGDEKISLSHPKESMTEAMVYAGDAMWDWQSQSERMMSRLYV
jgi:hypothetical protein